MIQSIFSALVLVALLGSCSPSAEPSRVAGAGLDVNSESHVDTQQEASLEDLDRVARDLFVAMRTKNASVIERLEPSSGAYISGGELRPEIIAFLDASNPSTGRRSLEEIAALGSIDVVIAPQGEDRAFVIYVPGQFRDRVGEAAFLENRWLRDYFACDFRATREGWKLEGSFCFDETDGPYPGEY